MWWDCNVQLQRCMKTHARHLSPPHPLPPSLHFSYRLVGARLVRRGESEHAAPCPYLTTFHGAFTSDDAMSVTLILELMDGGELQEFVSDGVCVPESVVVSAVARGWCQLLCGVFVFTPCSKQFPREERGR